MCVKSTLNTSNSASQALAVNNFVAFNTNNVSTGCAISHGVGSSTISLNQPGIYKVDFNANILGTAAGIVTLQLLNNNVAVAGALTSETFSVGTTDNVSFSTLIRVRPSCPCVTNVANLQVQLQTTAATLTNANVTVVKLA